MTKTFLQAFVLLQLVNLSSSATPAKRVIRPPQSTPIVSTYDAAKKQTIVRLAPALISGDKGKYRSLSFSVSYSYPGRTKRIPDTLSLELLTVVKVRKLNPDLYVVFLVDGAEVFLSSNRSAVRNPVPGKRWIGERLVFRIPYETFLNFARARQLAVRMDGLVFDFAENHLKSLRDFAEAIKD